MSPALRSTVSEGVTTIDAGSFSTVTPTLSAAPSVRAISVPCPVLSPVTQTLCPGLTSKLAIVGCRASHCGAPSVTSCPSRSYASAVSRILAPIELMIVSVTGVIRTRFATWSTTTSSESAPSGRRARTWTFAAACALRTARRTPPTLTVARVVSDDSQSGAGAFGIALPFASRAVTTSVVSAPIASSSISGAGKLNEAMRWVTITGTRTLSRPTAARTSVLSARTAVSRAPLTCTIAASPEVHATGASEITSPLASVATTESERVSPIAWKRTTDGVTVIAFGTTRIFCVSRGPSVGKSELSRVAVSVASPSRRPTSESPAIVRMVVSDEERRKRGDGTGAPSLVTRIGGSILPAAMTVESPAKVISMRPTLPGAITSATWQLGETMATTKMRAHDASALPRRRDTAYLADRIGSSGPHRRGPIDYSRWKDTLTVLCVTDYLKFLMPFFRGKTKQTPGRRHGVCSGARDCG